MSNTQVSGSFSRLLDWIVRMAYVNVLWIGFSVAGLLILGFAPATAALFTIIRKWLNGQRDFAIFPLFFKTFKTEFFKVNLLFYSLAVFGFALYFYGSLIQLLDGAIFTVASAIWISIILLFLVIMLYIFPVYVHFDLKGYVYIKYALLIGLTSPLKTLLMIVNAAAVYLLFLNFLTLIPFFFGSFLSLILMWIALGAFRKMPQK